MDLQKFQDWIKRAKRKTDNITEPSTVRLRPAFEEDQDNFDRLIKCLSRGGDKCVSRRWSWHAIL